MLLLKRYYDFRRMQGQTKYEQGNGQDCSNQTSSIDNSNKHILNFYIWNFPSWIICRSILKGINPIIVNLEEKIPRRDTHRENIVVWTIYYIFKQSLTHFMSLNFRNKTVIHTLDFRLQETSLFKVYLIYIIGLRYSSASKNYRSSGSWSWNTSRSTHPREKFVDIR